MCLGCGLAVTPSTRMFASTQSERKITRIRSAKVNVCGRVVDSNPQAFSPSAVIGSRDRRHRDISAESQVCRNNLSSVPSLPSCSRCLATASLNSKYVIFSPRMSSPECKPANGLGGLRTRANHVVLLQSVYGDLCSRISASHHCRNLFGVRSLAAIHEIEQLKYPCWQRVLFRPFDF